jgi:hypothetical protein
MQRHWLSNHEPLCSQGTETIDHLLLGCAFSREVWFKSIRRWNWQHLTPPQDASFAEWWIQVWKQVANGRRKAFDSLVVPVARCIWLQCNSQVFRNQTWMVAHLVQNIMENCEQWCVKLISRSALARE